MRSGWLNVAQCSTVMCVVGLVLFVAFSICAKQTQDKSKEQLCDGLALAFGTYGLSAGLMAVVCGVMCMIQRIAYLVILAVLLLYCQ